MGMPGQPFNAITRGAEMFHVGQKVVCVDTSPSKVGPANNRGGYWVPNWPDKYGVYTIRAIVPADNGVGLLLEEVVNPIRPFFEGPGEGNFCSTRFRPVIERKTDISIFTAMLDSKRKLVDA